MWNTQSQFSQTQKTADTVIKTWNHIINRKPHNIDIKEIFVPFYVHIKPLHALLLLYLQLLTVCC